MNPNSPIILELVNRYEHTITPSEARRAVHLELLRQSRMEPKPRSSPKRRTLRERIVNWVPFRQPSIPSTN